MLPFDTEAVFAIAVCSAVAITVIGYYLKGFLVRKAELDAAVRQAEMDTDLKAGMVERGFSADEIEPVLAAKRVSSDTSRNA